MGRLFGTDGIRGIANKELTPELAFKAGQAGAYILAKGKKGRIIIGKDTRKSGDMLEAAMIAGINSMGVDVMTLGIIPTPAVAYLTKAYDAIAGVVISASHNPGEYNGIKFFDGDGFKLDDSLEDEIESYILGEKAYDKIKIGSEIGSVVNNSNGSRDFINYLKDISDLDLNGITVAVDCGHGALYKIAPVLLEELGANVISVNTEPDGMNINHMCGSTNENIIKDLVVSSKADIGFSFDGDGDRIIAVDELGNVLNGDHILAICSAYLKKKGKLNKDTVVGTIMTNMGLDEYLNKNNMKIVKTKVGDRYILEEMIESGYVLGGEQSGHIIFLDYNTTGDGLSTGLKLLEVMINENKKMSELHNLMLDYPQVLVNAKVKEELKYSYLDNIDIKNAIDEIEEEFSGKGRVVIRPSGTEPLVRVMIEAKDGKDIEFKAKKLAGFIEERLA